MLEWIVLLYVSAVMRMRLRVADQWRGTEDLRER
jgi:hypothetical protein